MSASTQNQAFDALVFLYKHVVKKELGLIDAVRAKRPKRLPVVLIQIEVEKVLAVLSGTSAIMATVLYGSGLRLMECHRIRVKDTGFDKASRKDEGPASDLYCAGLRRGRTPVRV